MSLKSLYMGGPAQRSNTPFNDEQRRMAADPEFSRLWQARDELFARMGYSGSGSFIVPPEYASSYSEIMRPLVERYAALGGDQKRFPATNLSGQPVWIEPFSKGKFAARTALWAGTALGGAFGAGALGAPAAASSGTAALPTVTPGVGAGFASTIPVAAAPGALTAGTGIAGGVGTTAAVGAGSAVAPTVAGGSGAGGGGGGAGGGGTWANMLKGSTGDYVNAGASLAGAAMSGQHGLNVANRDLIKKLLAEYTRTQPYRQGMEKSFAGRLPTHMQANIAPLAPQGLQTLFGTKVGSPLLPDYSNIDYPRFPY